MEIRLLQALDAEEYFNLRLEALQKNPEAFAASFDEEKGQRVEKYIIRFQSENSFTFGAFDKGKLVGVVTLIQEKLIKLRHRATIVAMYVSPEKRGMGIGKALLEEVIAKAKEVEGVEQVYIIPIGMLVGCSIGVILSMFLPISLLSAVSVGSGIGYVTGYLGFEFYNKRS